MRLLRLRILCLVLAHGLSPITLLLAGVYWLPTGFLSFVWFGLIVMAVTAVSLAVSGYLARPVRDLAQAFDQMMRTGGEHQPRSRWIPAEFSRVQRAFSVYLQDSHRQIASAHDEARRCRQRIADAERLIQRSFGIIQSVFHASQDGMLVQDKAGQIMASNEALDRLLGHPAEHVAGRDGSKLLADMAARFEDASLFEALMEKTSADVAHDGEIDGATIDRPAKQLSVRTSPIRAEDGSIVGRLWLLHDSTEHKRLNHQLQQSQKMESIGQLAGGIAHDFNNLLTAIRGNLALAEIAGKEKPEDAKEKLKSATEATVRAAELVKQLLGYSRKTSNGPRATDLNKLTGEVENMLRHSIDPRISIESDHASNLWRAKVDAVNIEQVILNICLNARDSLPEAGGRITIKTANRRFDERTMPTPDLETGATEYIVISVKDNGSGIPEEQRAHIFDPFFSTKAPGKGTGLGLVTAQTIVQEHGGWIEFDREVGKGTEFRIFLPRCATSEGELEEATGSTQAREEQPARGRSGNLLIVDDENAVRSIAVTMLTHLGYTVSQAADGEEALKKVAEAEMPFDAILLDIYMPKLSGRDTFKQLRAEGCTSPVVVCSGFVVDPDEFHALTESGPGPVDIIQKPYSMEALARTIENAVAHGRRATRQGG